MTVGLLAAIFAIVMAIYGLFTVMTSYCDCSGTHCKKKDVITNWVVSQSLFTVLAIALLIVGAWNYTRLANQYDTLQKWADFKPCVDEYMQFAEEDNDSINEQFIKAKA